jgi:plasmid stabilization system protein ParE
MRVVFSSEAEADALSAFDFYEERSEGLGGRFRDHVGVALSRIQQSPEQSPIVYRNARRRLVERFPYAIIYRLYPGLVYVVALMHARQNPAAWKRRRVIGNERG